MPRNKITLERTYQASLGDVWELWTTAEGIESWWGPDGFAVKVEALDLRPGGTMRYAMTAVAKEQAEYLKRAGLPVTTVTSATFTEVQPQTRLGFDSLVDFIPDRQPYTTATSVELIPSGKSVRLIVSIEAMHDEHWTRMSVLGWESQLNKLGQTLAAHKE